jgi:hypothetical protein
MRRTRWVAAAVAVCVVVTGGARIVIADHDAPQGGALGRECSVATLRGDYGVQVQGTRPAPGGLTESVVGVVLRSYDGEGGFTQIDNVKGSVTGVVPDRPGFGTYEVNPDCTGTVRFQPGPGILLEERLVIVDSGDELRTAVMVPAAVMVTGVHRRVHAH